MKACISCGAQIPMDAGFCPKCGKPMVIRKGRFGKFLACTGYPKCKTTQRISKGETDDSIPDNKQDSATTKRPKHDAFVEGTDETCPKCGKPMVIRKGRFGRFLACTGYPKCKTTKRIPREKAQKEEADEETATAAQSGERGER